MSVRRIDPAAYAPSPAADLANVGVLVLAHDTTTERELRRLVGAEALNLLVSRVPQNAVCSLENLEGLKAFIRAAAELILPGGRVEAVALACTSAAAAIGHEALAELVAAAHPGAALVTPVDAALQAFRRLGINAIALVTPYAAPVHARVAAVFEAGGIRVVNAVAFGLEQETDIAAVGPDALHAAVAAVACPEADAVFISCTALDVVGLVDALEARAGKPVLTSNQVLAWDVLRRVSTVAARPVGALMHQQGHAGS